MDLAFSASSSLEGCRPELTICWCQSRTSFSTSGQLPKRKREPDSCESPSRRAYLGLRECDTVDWLMVWLYWFWNHSMQALWLGRTVCEFAQRRSARRWSRVSECRSFEGVSSAMARKPREKPTQTKRENEEDKERKETIRTIKKKSRKKKKKWRRGNKGPRWAQEGLRTRLSQEKCRGFGGLRVQELR
ncbi:hypothetical protein VTK73DRAFT_6276 [Phialemonium thermophilum]|uniref:Uncharacterized protein n=1 Tax=Phialemonium thermophilum TaxID=223376 RepID=A0ABR3WK12_9PEZI